MVQKYLEQYKPTSPTSSIKTGYESLSFDFYEEVSKVVFCFDHRNK